MEPDVEDFVKNWKMWETYRFNGQVFIIDLNNPLITGEYRPVSMEDDLVKDISKVNVNALMAIKDLLEKNHPSKRLKS